MPRLDKRWAELQAVQLRQPLLRDATAAAVAA